MRSAVKQVFLSALFFWGSQLYASDVPSALVQDDSSLRVAIQDTWLTAQSAAVLRNRAFTQNLSGGAAVQVRAERHNQEFSVILARQRNGVFPGWAQGSWIYTRDVSSGEGLRIRVFLRSDPNTFVQFRPFGRNRERSQIDVVLYDAYVVRSLPIGIPFDQLLTMPVEEALALAGSRFPRRYFDPNIGLYRHIAPSQSNANNFISRVRSFLPGLIFADDGARDEHNRYVFIASLQPQHNPLGLNCSGFVKWMIDGMLHPVTGQRLAITPLKAAAVPRDHALIEMFEVRDALFGLDWTRNLALETARTLRSSAFATVENIEVRSAPFSSVIRRRSGRAEIQNFPGHLENAGFAIEGLRALLYTLAIDEPGYLYLASVNREWGRAPRLRQHYHVAALVPYFNEFGTFQTAVFESATETNLTGFIARHPNAMVNLVRIPIEGFFNP